MADVNLSKAVRSNLLSLQSTAASMAKTQERLATGLKVNSALDNPTNFFTAASLNSRAGDMSNLLDSMSNGIKTIEAADNGLSSITKTVESMQSTLRQARQDKSFKTQSFAIDTASIGTSSVKTLDFSGGAVGSAPVSIDLNSTATPAQSATVSFDFQAVTFDDANDRISYAIHFGNGPYLASIRQPEAIANTVGNDGVVDTTAEMVAAMQQDFDTDFPGGFTASSVGNRITVTANFAQPGDTLSYTSATGINGGGAAMGTGGLMTNMTSTTAVAADPSAAGVKSVDALVAEINANASLKGAVRASNDNGKLRIENLSTEELEVEGVGSDGEIDGTSGTADIGGNEVRKNLVKQFNELRDQLDKLADDASFNGINLLRGDKLKLTFNETGTSTIDIQAKDADGDPTSVNNTTLGITAAVDADFDSDTSLDARLGKLGDALGKLRSQASAFGSNLSIVENRNDFTKSMINTLETGAANLTLADTNQEAANLLALQTRQQLSSTALSMASQADQAVLRLF